MGKPGRGDRRAYSPCCRATKVTRSPPPTKVETLRELKQRISALEYQEESAVCAALADGLHVIRRHDASPAAILGVKLTKAIMASGYAQAASG
jgi:hypothetical protein